MFCIHCGSEFVKESQTLNKINISGQDLDAYETIICEGTLCTCDDCGGNFISINGGQSDDDRY